MAFTEGEKQIKLRVEFINQRPRWFELVNYLIVSIRDLDLLTKLIKNERPQIKKCKHLLKIEISKEVSLIGISSLFTGWVESV